MLPVFKKMKPFNKRESLKRLEQIGNLPDGWNDSEARSFPSEFLLYVRGILSSLEIDPDIFPTARGSIQLEYNNNSGDYLEFEIFADGKIKKFYWAHAQFCWDVYLLALGICLEASQILRKK